MRRNLGHLWRHHRILVLVFALALALTGAFTVRLVVSGLHWSNPANRDARIEGWMPLRYVARSWDVPPEVLGAALGLTPGAGMTVAEIAAARGTGIEGVRADLMAAIGAWRAAESQSALPADPPADPPADSPAVAPTPAPPRSDD
jgi:hypothetical protein